MSTFERRRGVCVVCLADHALRKDGTIGQHGTRGKGCSGTGQQPLEGTVRVMGTTISKGFSRGKCPECLVEWRVLANGRLASHGQYAAARRLGECPGTGELPMNAMST